MHISNTLLLVCTVAAAVTIAKSAASMKASLLPRAPSGQPTAVNSIDWLTKPYDTVVTWGPTILPRSYLTVDPRSKSSSTAIPTYSFTRLSGLQDRHLGGPEIEVPGRAIASQPNPEAIAESAEERSNIIQPRAVCCPGHSRTKIALLIALPVITAVTVFFLALRCFYPAIRSRRLAKAPPYTGHGVPMEEAGGNSAKAPPYPGNGVPSGETEGNAARRG